MQEVTRDICRVDYPPEVYGSTPNEVEATIQEIMERIYRDENGFIRSGVNAGTMQPFKPEEVKDRPFGIGGYSECASMPRDLKPVWLNYEDSGIASGRYLCAMLNKYAAAGDVTALDRAVRTFRAIRLLWENAARQNVYGRGWMPKPYGGIGDVGQMFECSPDQYARMTQGIDAFYRQTAGDADKQIIKEMVLSFADWWLEHDYTTNYFGNCCWWKRTSFAHAIGYFLYLNALAQSFSPNDRYRRAFDLWFDLRQGLAQPLKKVCINGKGIALECCERLMELRPEHGDFWRLCAKTNAEAIISEVRDGDPRMQICAYAAGSLCAAHRLFPDAGYKGIVEELLTAFATG